MARDKGFWNTKEGRALWNTCEGREERMRERGIEYGDKVGLFGLSFGLSGVTNVDLHGTVVRGDLRDRFFPMVQTTCGQRYTFDGGWTKDTTPETVTETPQAPSPAPVGESVSEPTPTALKGSGSLPPVTDYPQTPIERYAMANRLNLRVGDRVEWVNNNGNATATGVVVMGKKYPGPRVRLDDEHFSQAYVELTERFRKATR